MMERLPQERIGAAVSNLAHVRPLLEETLAYCKERRAFGTSIGSFQHRRRRPGLRRPVRRRARRGTLSAVQAAKAKWWGTDVQNKVIDACVQLFGATAT